MPRTAPDALRIYAIFLSLVGAALVAIVYAFITDALIRSRLLQTLGRRTVPGDIRDHVVVAGLGAIGYRVALGIQARGVPVVVVESQDDGRFVSAARAAGIPVVIGDARHREVLEDVRLERARALVCATSDDLVNLSTALNGRALRPDLRVVVRLFDPEFALRVQRGFGIRFTRSVSQLAAPAFAAAATRTEVVATVPVGDRRVALFARLRVPEGSALEGVPAADAGRAGRAAGAGRGRSRHPTTRAGTSRPTRSWTPARRSWSPRRGPAWPTCSTWPRLPAGHGADDRRPARAAARGPPAAVRSAARP